MRLHELPRFPLARLPTPLHEARRLRDALGGERRCPRIFLKRDDLTDLALGGNKARKLEFLVGDALARNATALVTTGGAQSNHARMTAAAAALAGLRAALVLTAENGIPDDEGNLLLGRLLDADVHFVTAADTKGASLDEAEEAKVEDVMRMLRDRGERPYLVVLGGSDGVGVLGYVDASRELVEQIRQAGIGASSLYYASGSRGTQAGIELGARIFHADYRPIGIAVSPGGAEKQLKAVRIAADAADRIGVAHSLDAADLITDEDHYGEGYAIPTAAGSAAIRLLARTEAIFLDPVYTAKAMAGMFAHIQAGRYSPDEILIFLHTGGVPALFARSTGVLAVR